MADIPESKYSAHLVEFGSIKLYTLLKKYRVGEPHTLLRSAIEILSETKVAAIGMLPAENAYGEKQYQLIADDDEPEARQYLTHPEFGPTDFYFDLSIEFAQRMLSTIVRQCRQKIFKSISLTNIPLEIIQNITSKIKVSKIVLTIQSNAFSTLDACYKVFIGVKHVVYNIDLAELDGTIQYPMAESVQTVELYPTSSISAFDLIPFANRASIKRIGLNAVLWSVWFDSIRGIFPNLSDVMFRQSRHEDYGIPLIKSVVDIWHGFFVLVVKANEADTLIQRLRQDEQFRITKGENECGEVELRLMPGKSMYDINIENADALLTFGDEYVSVNSDIMDTGE